MKILLILSWRNIWRHPGRSGALLAAVVAGLWAGVLTIGTVNGMLRQRMDYLIDSEITHVQIHHPDFPADGHAWQFIPDHERIASWLDGDPRVRSHAARTLTDGMLQSPVKTSGVRIRGIDVPAESRTTTFHRKLVAGNYLDSDVRNPVIIGKSQAQIHNMEIGDRIVLFFEDSGNELTAAAFNIVGLFESASEQYDKRHVFVRSEDLIALLANQPIYHEFAIMLSDQDDAPALAAELNAAFSGSSAQTWSERSPELRMLVGYGRVVLLIITIVIMLALAFGILNTMLMSIFERLREIGMLLCVGMSRTRIFGMILLESLILTLIGAVTGIALATATIAYFSETGINLEMFATGLGEVGYDRVIYPFLDPAEFAAIALVVIAITLLASVYPALRAIHIHPVDAARDK